MPSIYDRMTEEQLQTQIIHTERGARARVITVIAESKIRRAQILQAAECEREGIVQRETAIRREHQRAIVAESKERAQNIKKEGHQKLKQMKKTGHIDRELMEQHYNLETAAKVQAIERENELKMEMMREEHALKLLFMKEENQVRMQHLKGSVSVEEPRVVQPALDLRTSKQPKVRDTSRFATEQREINHKTGEVLTSVIAIDDELAEKVEKIAGGDLSDTDRMSMVLGQAMKMRISDDTSIELRNMYASFNKSRGSPTAPLVPARNERVRELRVSSSSKKVATPAHPRSPVATSESREHIRISKQAEQSISPRQNTPLSPHVERVRGLKNSNPSSTNLRDTSGSGETREHCRGSRQAENPSTSKPSTPLSPLHNERVRVLNASNSSPTLNPQCTSSTYQKGECRQSRQAEQVKMAAMSDDATIELTDVTINNGTTLLDDNMPPLDYPREVLRRSRERCPRHFTAT